MKMAAGGDVLYAWQEQEADGSWGIVAVMVPSLEALAPLVMRDAGAAASVADLAKAHGRAVGRPIRLAKFRLEESHPE